MSTFKVPVVVIEDVCRHPGADRLDIARIGGYKSVVRRDSYKNGDKVAYIPEGALIPNDILKHIGLWDKKKNKGMLAGSKGNRVKAIKLRGILSQGVLFRPDNINSFNVEDDVAEHFGITKYEPPVPINMSGQVVNVTDRYTFNYDIENINRYPDEFNKGDLVVFTEKLHGTFVAFSYCPFIRNDELPYGNTLVYSKGLGAKGMVFKDNPANENNLYLRTWKKLFRDTGVWNKVIVWPGHDTQVTVMGEIFGPGCQDLHYGLNSLGIRVFDVHLGLPRHGVYLSHSRLKEFAEFTGVDLVPELYRGPFSNELVEQHRDGTETISNTNQIREGIVITPVQEHHSHKLHAHRLKLKAVSPNYLMRRKGTEYN